ncbi:MAG: hypothetical protein DHS20C17_18940 [Cyclobacteriaceae bacterium]|nr:MAG: hypothetical protein DHS20C17_18940 [Cyclobacteriaceae bacterium]
MKRLMVLIGSIVIMFSCQQADKPAQAVEDMEPDENAERIQTDSISGLVIDENFELIRGQCTACHSAMLITQNNASRDGWEQMIRWMQKDQGLWDLGENEPKILDYLSKHYGLKKKGRRAPLTDVEWYELKDEL